MSDHQDTGRTTYGIDTTTLPRDIPAAERVGAPVASALVEAFRILTPEQAAERYRWYTGPLPPLPPSLRFDLSDEGES